MSTWIAGRVYDYYGQKLRCVRRYFGGETGCLELVDLQFVGQAVAGGPPARPGSDVFTRTARTLAPCVVPKVTETLGGVLRPDACDHRPYGRVLASGGANTGRECCDGCGGPIAQVDAWSPTGNHLHHGYTQGPEGKGHAPEQGQDDPRHRRAVGALEPGRRARGTQPERLDPCEPEQPGQRAAQNQEAVAGQQIDRRGRNRSSCILTMVTQWVTSKGMNSTRPPRRPGSGFPVVLKRSFLVEAAALLGVAQPDVAAYAVWAASRPVEAPILRGVS